MTRLCEGRVVVVTGAGRGIGREHALLLARHGAKLVVNDLGGSVSGEGKDMSLALEVVAEIQAHGGEAVANHGNVVDFDQAGEMVQQAIDTFGRLDVLVTNAGILRDRMLINMSPQDWDAVMSVHLRGTFCPTRHAAAYWRDCSKAGYKVDARVITTASPSGLYGNVGQANYGAAKAGVAAFTQIIAEELYRYGVTANAVAPAALTRMTADLDRWTERQRQRLDPYWIAPIVTWLSSSASRGVTGRVFDVSGRSIAIAEGWHLGPSANPTANPEDLGPIVADLMSQARPNAGIDGRDREGPGRPHTTTLE